MKKIHEGRYVLIPYNDKTHGHFTHYYAAVWKPFLTSFTGPPPRRHQFGDMPIASA
jgi:hypothetical protein